MKLIKISSRWVKLPFNGCDPEFIKETCKAGCEFSSNLKIGILVTIHPSERKQIESLGATVNDKNVIVPVVSETLRGTKKCCPFHTCDGLCKLHNTPHKPFGCRASPFTLNSKGTLIIRHRYIKLKCYNNGKKLPAYIAFADSLKLIVGDKYDMIYQHLKSGGGDIHVPIQDDVYNKLMENDLIKKKVK